MKFQRQDFTPFPRDNPSYRDVFAWMFQDYGEDDPLPTNVIIERLEAARAAGLDLTFNGTLLDEKVWDTIEDFIGVLRLLGVLDGKGVSQ